MYAVRRARAGDAPLLPEIERSAAGAFRAIAGLGWIADGAVQDEPAHRAMIAAGDAFVAADAADAPVGFVNGAALGDAFHVREMSVRADWQRRGIGRALMATVRAHAERRGLRAVTLTTFRDVPWNGPFYQRLGFVELPPEGVPAPLRAVLAEEAASGLPAGRRCAMRLSLPGADTERRGAPA
ncbi:GNAT family N-acetyltransferase [Xanthobacter sp. V0B-10]|uniref:GNAT family N-acetyltransferase n=1 Tax=Xanthobacter albus TaxID=3119929 RepID=UPI003727B11A